MKTLEDPSDFWQLWQSQAMRAGDLHEMAILGGKIASSLSEVFMAGYQVAMRQVFDLQGPAWAAFCVSEGADNQPLVEFDDDHKISGVKTWVAAADVSEIFIVKVGRGPDARYCKLGRSTEGLSIKIKAPGEFLPDLMIGQLHMAKVKPEATLSLERSQLKAFPMAEAGAIFVTFLSFLASQGSHSGARILSRYGEAATRHRDVKAIKAMVDEMRQSECFDDGMSMLVPNWQQDRKLLDMYQAMVMRV